MIERAVQEEAAATLTRLEAKHPELKKELQRARAFAIYPAIGRASLVLGGSYGHGAVYERGRQVGFTSIVQMTLGVQIGGQTISEVVILRGR